MYKNLNCDLVGITGRQSEIIELALTYGFRGIDIDIKDIVKRCSRGSFESATRFLTSSKLKVGTFEIPVDLDADEDTFEKQLAELPKVAEVAGRVETRAGVLHIPCQTDRLPYPEYFEVIRKRIDQIVDILAEEEVQVGLAFTPSQGTEEKQFKFIQDVEGFVVLANSCKRTGIILDLWTWHCGGGSPDDLAKIGLDRVLAIRLADCKEGIAAGAATEEDCQLPGTTGTIDYADYMQQLAALEKDIPVSARGNFASIGGKRDAFIERIQEKLHEILVSAGLPSQLRKPAEIADSKYASNSPA